MFRHQHKTLSFLVLALAAMTAFAGGGPNLYKYKNEKGVQVIDSSIPPEIAAKGGYQIVSRTGSVIQDVPVVDQAAAAAQRKQAADSLANAAQDADLRKQYSAPVDAVRLRNRQIDAISLKSDFAKGQLLQLNSKRKAALDQAAQLERRGQTVPAAMRDNINRLNAQVADQENQLKGFDADKQRIRDEFSPIIARLNVIYPDKALTPEQIDPPAPAPAPVAAKPGAAPAATAAPAKQ